MKKYISLLIALTLALTSLGALPAFAANKKLSVVATTFPLYDWARQIVGADNDAVELTLLLDSGVDLHSYQPTAQDIMKIATCDLFLYVGGESDKWVDDALAEAVRGDIRAVNLLSALGDAAKEEETVEGMEAEDHDHDEDEDEDEIEYDEHIWLSLRNAKALCQVIADALSAADPDNAALYQANNAAYAEQLTALDARYAAMIEGAHVKTMLFCDRFPFRYLADDYDLSYYAAFSGCSAETEASFATIAFLAGKLRELQLPAVLTIEGANHKIAQTVVQTAGMDVRILALNSMQGTTLSDVRAGASYLAIMESNLSVFEDALNGGK